MKNGKQADISRERKQVKAFRDTWKDGIHGYLTYVRDRMTVAQRATESGSIFVQIGASPSSKACNRLNSPLGCLKDPWYSCSLLSQRNLLSYLTRIVAGL